MRRVHLGRGSRQYVRFMNRAGEQSGGFKHRVQKARSVLVGAVGEEGGLRTSGDGFDEEGRRQWNSG